MKKQAYNPYLPEWEYIPDGEPKVFGDRLYIFGSHDRFDGEDTVRTIMFHGQRRQMIFQTGDMKGLFFVKTRHPGIPKTNRTMHRMWFRE